MTSGIAELQRKFDNALLDIDVLTALVGDEDERDPWLRSSEVLARVVEEHSGKPEDPREMWIGGTIVISRRLRRLVERGWVERDPRSGGSRYRITACGFRVGARACDYGSRHGETYGAAERFVQRVGARAGSAPPS